MGSMASARRASICSVTTIVPSSAVLLAPTRPEIISAVSSGATSRSVPKPAPQPSRPSAPTRFTSGAAWMTMMAPGEERRDDDDGQRLDGHLVEVPLELRVVDARREREEARHDAPEEHAHAADGLGRCRGTPRRSMRDAPSASGAAATAWLGEDIGRRHVTTGRASRCGLGGDLRPDADGDEERRPPARPSADADQRTTGSSRMDDEGRAAVQRAEEEGAEDGGVARRRGARRSGRRCVGRRRSSRRTMAATPPVHTVIDVTTWTNSTLPGVTASSPGRRCRGA